MIAALFFVQSCVSQLKLHGGPVMNFPISLHYLYYGPWSTKDEEVIIMDFVGRNIGQSDWYSISTCMEDIQGNPVTDQIDLPTTFIHSDYKNWGQTISTKAIVETIVQGIAAEANIAFDPNDLYVLISHDDVSTPLACNDACGYHNYFNNSQRTPIKYLHVASGGISNVCSSCNFPNGPWGGLTNQLVNSFAHHLVNTVSDPVPFTGWYDPQVVEAASKCTGNFVGSIPFNPNKNKNWNVVISSGNEKHWFLLQANWDIISNSCRLYPLSDCSQFAPPTPLQSNAHNPSSGSMMKAGISVLVSTLFALAFLF